MTTCPACGETLLPGTSDGKDALFCRRCWDVVTPPSEPVLPLLPGRHTRKVVIREEVAQRHVVTALRFDGYTVLVTSRHRKRTQCRPPDGCGRWFFPAEGDGCDEGIPDLYITRRTWPPGLWFGLEMKGTDTPVSEAQAALAAQGRLRILRAEESLDWTVREARRYVRAFEVASGIACLERVGG